MYFLYRSKGMNFLNFDFLIGVHRNAQNRSKKARFFRRDITTLVTKTRLFKSRPTTTIKRKTRI